MNETQSKQVAMHQDFFDRCRFAIDHGFYMEAILMEYAAMEARLEVMLGVVNLPCSKQLEAGLRSSINISHRIRCTKWMVQNSPLFEATKLDKQFFDALNEWIKERNRYVHGLYKNEELYEMRKEDACVLAKEGLEHCRLLYNETRRLRRELKKNPQFLDNAITCHSKQCKLRKETL